VRARATLVSEQEHHESDFDRLIEVAEHGSMGSKNHPQHNGEQRVRDEPPAHRGLYGAQLGRVQRGDEHEIAHSVQVEQQGERLQAGRTQGEPKQKVNHSRGHRYHDDAHIQRINMA
jgi:hypothetical protein